MILKTLHDMVIGGQAVVQYGIPRFTQYIDDINKIIKKIESTFRILVKNPEDFVSETWILPKVISGRKLDIEDAKSVLDVQSKKISMKYIENKLKLFSKELDNDEIYF